MPKRVPTISVVVIRPNDAGKNVRKTVEPGKPFNFTDDEIAQINRIHPGGLRKPVNETSTAETEAADEAAPEGNAKPTATKGKTKKPTAAAKAKQPAPGAGEGEGADADAEEEAEAEEEAAAEDDDI